jgi:hypothetical protein
MFTSMQWLAAEITSRWDGHRRLTGDRGEGVISVAIATSFKSGLTTNA